VSLFNDSRAARVAGWRSDLVRFGWIGSVSVTRSTRLTHMSVSLQELMRVLFSYHNSFFMVPYCGREPLPRRTFFRLGTSFFDCDSSGASSSSFRCQVIITKS
jgi:hypothetical protein